MARKGDWIQSQHSECIPTWSLEACLYFLSLSESVKRNLPGSVKFTQVKEAIGTRIYQIIAEQQQQQQLLQHTHMWDYLFLADTLNSIFFVLYLLYPETVVPPIPNTSTKAIKEAILIAHSLLKVGFPNSHNNDNNKTSGDKENTPEPIPEPPPPPPPTQPPPPMKLRKRHQLIELVASEVNIACKWTLDMCIDFLLLSEPYQSKCLLKGQHLKGIKDLACCRIHSIFKETVISTSLSLTSSSQSADGDDQAGLDDAHFRSVVVETINILVQNIRQNHDRDPSYSLGSFPTVTEQDLTSMLHSSASSTTTTNTTGNHDLNNADNNLCILNSKLRHAVQLLQQKYKSLHPT